MIRWAINPIRKVWSIQIMRFLIVGGLNTVFGYSVFAVLILLNIHYVLATLISQICGALFNFKTYGTLVFKNKDNRLIFKFFGVYIFTYLLNIALLKIFDMYGVGSLVAGAIILLPVSLVSFLLNRKYVFRVAAKSAHVEKSTG